MFGKPFSSRPIVLVLSIALLLLYGFAGLVNEVLLVTQFGLPENVFMGDFRIYERALRDLMANTNPYLERTIGAAFIYPPPAIIPVMILDLFPAPFHYVAVIIVDITLLFWVVDQLRRYYDLSLQQSWWWYYISLLFGPALETITVGQINLVPFAGIMLLFIWETKRPGLSGSGLGLAVVTKMSPVMLFWYLFVQKRWRVMLFTIVFLLGISLLTGLLFGFHHYRFFLEAFLSAAGFLSSDLNNQGLIVKLIAFDLIPPQSVRWSQLLLTAYFGLLLIISAVLYHCTREREPLFIISIIVMVLYPPFAWYHHYLFLLFPIFVLLGWKQENPFVAVWLVVFLFILQVDRYRLTSGLLIHLCGNLTILGLIVYQLKQARPILNPGYHF